MVRPGPRGLTLRGQRVAQPFLYAICPDVEGDRPGTTPFTTRLEVDDIEFWTVSVSVRLMAGQAHLDFSHRASALSGSAISSTAPYQDAFQSASGRPVNSIRLSG